MDDGNQQAADADQGLAPVIPLFGAAEDRVPTRDVTREAGSSRGSRSPRRSAGGRSVPTVGSRDDRGDGGADDSWHVTWTDDVSPSGDLEESEAEMRAAAEKALLKKLRSRSLSEREARTVLKEHALADGTVDAIIDSFLRHGYLDDLRLAEQLAYIGADRKRQGRQAIAQTLTARGIPRAVADAVLADTEDDDAERALEFARHKVRSLRGLDRDVALRRLVGQLARRGYAGSLAMTAARTALDEGAAASGVRFE